MNFVKGIVCILMVFLSFIGYAQEKDIESDFCKNLIDENQHILIPQKGLVLLYFFDPKNQNSIQMKDIINQLKLEKSEIICFQVDTSLSLGLKKTYRVFNLPSLVILQDKRVIYGTNGFTDDLNALKAILDFGIQNHLLITSAK